MKGEGGERSARVCWKESAIGVEDPGCSPGAATNVFCDMDKLLTLVEVQFLHLLFEGWAKAVVSIPPLFNF